MGFFAGEKVNRGRQPELDWLKALCIVGMIMLHIYQECATNADGLLYRVLDTLRFVTGAATFMICMGVGMCYSRRQDAWNCLVRGLELLTVGQFLNLLRNAAPNLIAYWIKGDALFIANALLVIHVDILSFAGLAFVFMALMKKLNIPALGILIVGGVLNIAVFPFGDPPIAPSNYLISQLLGYFVVTNAVAYFPFASYFVFVAFGYFVGGMYPRIADKEALSNRVLLVLGPICALYYALRINVPFPLLPEFGSDIQYMLIPGPDALAICLSSLVFLALFHKLTKRMGGKSPALVNHISANINSYYCVSYMFTQPMQTLLLATMGALMPGMLLPTLYALLVIALCYFIIDFNEKRLGFHLVALSRPTKDLVFAATWVCTALVVAYAFPKIEVYANVWNNFLLP